MERLDEIILAYIKVFISSIFLNHDNSNGYSDTIQIILPVGNNIQISDIICDDQIIIEVTNHLNQIHKRLDKCLQKLIFRCFCEFKVKFLIGYNKFLNIFDIRLTFLYAGFKNLDVILISSLCS